MKAVWIGTLLILAASLWMGCSITPGDYYRVEVDPGFSPTQTEAILAGLQDWQSHVSALTLDIEIGNPSDCQKPHNHLICLHPSTGVEVDNIAHAIDGVSSEFDGITWARRGSGSLGDTAGLDGTDGGIIWLALDHIASDQANNPSSPMLRIVASHEVGHAMGLEHYQGSPNLMYPGPSQVTTVSCHDVQAWYQIRKQVVPECGPIKESSL
jgi:Matrixin